jgi:3-hydroxyacyl-CoA dehydrogenase
MTTINEVVEFESHGEVGVLWLNNPPVNAISRVLRDGLFAGMHAARKDPACKAIVIACRGRTFIAGADIREFGRRMEGTILFDALDAVDESEKPVVAALHGTVYGGGLETALCCHGRVAARTARLGLPEVKLGLLPGAGGTQRLPRIIGVERALDMMIAGDPIGAGEALSLGLVDEVVDESALLTHAIAMARRLLTEPWSKRRVRNLEGELVAVRSDTGFFARFREKIAQRTRGLLAPETIVHCVETGVHESFDAGVGLEREGFNRLVRSTESIAQRYNFFAEREAQKVPDVPATTTERAVKQVGIIGAGTMGGGIAMCFANAGIPVTLVEVKHEALERGLSTVRKNYERSVKSGRLSAADVDQRMALIRGNLSLESLADSDLVIEAVYESMPVKQEVFGKLDAICKPGAILASNTSYLDLNQIAASTKRRQDVIGLHFFSPANVMKLLEVVRGKHTASDVIATAMALGKRIGKVSVLVGVCPGFVGNRILVARTNQANKLILEGALPWDVDRVLYDFGFPMGPFAMQDLAGLDIGWDPKRSRGDSLRDRLCEQGRRGQKTGAGYYNYDPQTRERTPEPKVAELIETFARDTGIKRRSFSDQEILERCIFPMINEGAKILQEGIAIRASDIDVVWVNGYGWPVYRGGPMFYADRVGLPLVVETLERFRAQDQSEFWKPAPLLAELARTEATFTKA